MTLESQGNFCAQSAPCWGQLGGEGLRKLYIRKDDVGRREGH